MKELYNRLAEDTLSSGLQVAWANMEADDMYRAVEAAREIKNLEPKSILEVAAGYGFVTKQILEQNPNVPITCLEVASPFCKILRSNDCLEVLEEDFTTYQTDRVWDVVTVMQVLEHLENLELLELVLRKITSWAARFVIVEIPEGGPIDGERHILTLTTEVLIGMMSRIGLNVMSISTMLPSDGQAKNGYTAMVRLLGVKT